LFDSLSDIFSDHVEYLQLSISDKRISKIGQFFMKFNRNLKAYYLGPFSVHLSVSITV